MPSNQDELLPCADGWWVPPPRAMLDRDACYQCGRPFDAHPRSVARRASHAAELEHVRQGVWDAVITAMRKHLASVRDRHYGATYEALKALEAARTPASPATVRLFEAKLLGFSENDRINLCEDCLRRAQNDDLVIFSCCLPAPTAQEDTGEEE